MLFQKTVQNPLLQDTFRRRFHVWLCATQGHFIKGYYNTVPQIYCRRCGVKLPYADEVKRSCSEWTHPWGDYL